MIRNHHRPRLLATVLIAASALGLTACGGMLDIGDGAGLDDLSGEAHPPAPRGEVSPEPAAHHAPHSHPG